MFTTTRPVTLLAPPVLAAPLALGACGSSGPAGGSGGGAALAQAPAPLCGADKAATSTIAKTDKMLDEACAGVAS